MVPGHGVGGVVAALGPGVDQAWLGRRVVAGTGGSGGYAERVAVDVSSLIEVPEGVGMDDAVALLSDGRTAGALVRAAQLQPGERVLVEAAGGGVGTLLTQLCVLHGARVVATARGAEKLRLARDLGAELAVDYTEPGWADRVRAGVGDIDVVFDDVAASRGVKLLRGVPVGPAEGADLTRGALADAAAGRLHPVIGQRFPLADAAADAQRFRDERVVRVRTSARMMTTLRGGSVMTVAEANATSGPGSSSSAAVWSRMR